MTRTERIKKLANAVKAYRGACHVVTLGGDAAAKWIRAPQPDRRFEVVKWLNRLGRTPEQINADAVAIELYKIIKLLLTQTRPGVRV